MPIDELVELLRTVPSYSRRFEYADAIDALLADRDRLRVALTELVACKNEDAALFLELNRILYTSDDRKFPSELHDRINANDPRTNLAWSAAHAALKETAP